MRRGNYQDVELNPVARDGSYQLLTQLLALSRGGRMLPNSADYLRRKPLLAVRYTDIAARIHHQSYHYRSELLLSLIAHLFWRGRKGWKPHQPVNCQWLTVLNDPRSYVIPICTGRAQTRDLQHLDAVQAVYRGLVPAANSGLEDQVFSSVYEILLQQPAGEELALPVMSSIAAAQRQPEQHSVFVSRRYPDRYSPDRLSPDSLVFSDREIERCSHSDRYIQSVQRFLMLLKNQYFWCSGPVTQKQLTAIEPQDRIIVCASHSHTHANIHPANTMTTTVTTTGFGQLLA